MALLLIPLLHNNIFTKKPNIMWKLLQKAQCYIGNFYKTSNAILATFTKSLILFWQHFTKNPMLFWQLLQKAQYYFSNFYKKPNIILKTIYKKLNNILTTLF